MSIGIGRSNPVLRYVFHNLWCAEVGVNWRVLWQLGFSGSYTWYYVNHRRLLHCKPFVFNYRDRPAFPVLYCRLVLRAVVQLACAPLQILAISKSCSPDLQCYGRSTVHTPACPFATLCINPVIVVTCAKASWQLLQFSSFIAKLSGYRNQACPERRMSDPCDSAHESNECIDHVPVRIFPFVYPAMAWAHQDVVSKYWIYNLLLWNRDGFRWLSECWVFPWQYSHEDNWAVPLYIIH